LAAKSPLHSGAGEIMRSGERHDLYDEKID